MRNERFTVYGRSKGGSGFVLFRVTDSRTDVQRTLSQLWDSARLSTIKVTRSIVK